MHSMIRRRVLGASLIAVLALGAVIGCGAQSSDGGGDKRVRLGALYLDAQGFYGGIRKGIQVGAASQSLELIGQNSQGDAARESSFMATLVGSKVDAIVMSPVSDTGSVPLVRQAADAGIPVVCYNTCVSGDAARKFVKALVTTDQVKMGEQVGNLSARYFLKKQINAPLVAILNCDVYEACRQRKAGFKKALSAKLPGVRYVADQPGFLPEEAPKTAADILTANGERRRPLRDQRRRHPRRAEGHPGHQARRSHGRPGQRHRRPDRRSDARPAQDARVDRGPGRAAHGPLRRSAGAARGPRPADRAV